MRPDVSESLNVDIPLVILTTNAETTGNGAVGQYGGHVDSGLAKEWMIPAHLQSSVFKLSKDLIDSIHEEGIVAYTS